MAEDDISSNIEWEQDKGFETKSRVSRRVDVKKLLKAQAKDRRNFKTTAAKAKTLAPELKKLRTKIKDIYDDDEDDENEIVFHFSMDDESSSLFSALKEEEKKELQFKQTLKNQNMQQTAGKMEAVIMADKMAKDLGLKRLSKKIALDSIQDITQSSETYDKALAKDISSKTSLDLKGLSPKDASFAVKGLKKMRQASTASQKINLKEVNDIKEKDLIAIGKSKNTRETAEMILEKSGRTEPQKMSRTRKESETQKVQKALRDTRKKQNVRE